MTFLTTPRLHSTGINLLSLCSLYVATKGSSLQASSHDGVFVKLSNDDGQGRCIGLAAEAALYKLSVQV